MPRSLEKKRPNRNDVENAVVQLMRDNEYPVDGKLIGRKIIRTSLAGVEEVPYQVWEKAEYLVMVQGG